MLLFFILLTFYIVCGYVEVYFIRKRCTVSVIRLWNIFLVFPLWFLISFRSETVGNDTIAYKHLYDFFSTNDLSTILSETDSYGNIESGFVVLSYFFREILGVSYDIFQIIVSTFICIGFYSFFNRYSSNVSLSWFLFIVLLSFSRSMNIMRQMLAVSLSLYSFSLLLNKKYLKYITYILLLSLFHKTSLV
ncbi:EpsG family protein, partial [Avibacterium avium]